MAKRVITVLTDDIDGGDADRTIEFGLDGVNFTIDLSDKNIGKLRKALVPRGPYPDERAQRIARGAAAGSVEPRPESGHPGMGR